jgi:predicted Rossmann-fold nucleotide-binding protein
LHAKPAGLLNLLGYYDGLLRFLDHAAAECFVRSDHRDMILARPSAAELLAALEGWSAPPRTPAKWIDADGTDVAPAEGGVSTTEI